MFFNKKKFQSLSPSRKHQIAADLLLKLWADPQEKTWQEYKKLQDWLSLPLLLKEQEAIADRHHFHLRQSGVEVKEQDLLPRITKQDGGKSPLPFLPLTIYLEDLRSAFNVGSILRTTEAFRLGRIAYSEKTPPHTHPKVRETSMGAYEHVSCEIAELDNLPRPFIALETVENASTVFDFSFPPIFTLVVGNEEYGISKETLEKIDEFVQIPLVGWKNSLNVASAFAIAAAQIHNQLSVDGNNTRRKN